MTFKDDDEIKTVLPEDASAGENSETIHEGKTDLILPNNNDRAPLDQTEFTLMFELTGAGSGLDRAGLDLVTVLDVSGSMGTEKLDRVKKSMEFVINKLSRIDRLSVVTFSTDATRLCWLRQISKDSKPEITTLVKGLQSGGNTNIASGLEMALAVLGDRRYTSGRTVAVMLMSDGDENIRKADELSLGNVPVFTFGFGENHEPQVLTKIAMKSAKGTFSDVRKEGSLSVAFAKCLGGLLTVILENLELTLKSVKSTIINVSVGTYDQVPEGNSVKVLFGNLYIKEKRTVIVKLLLPPVPPRPRDHDILIIEHKYNSPKDPATIDAPPETIRIRRMGTAVMPVSPEILIAQSNMKAAEMMKRARILADDQNLTEARKTLADAQTLLEDVVTDEPSPVIEMMNYELSELMDTLQSQQVYEKEGRPFALSSETSHGRQRYAARGDVGYLNSFSTPRMEKYAEQVQAYEEDPTKPVPTEEEDVKKELASDPLAPIAGPLRYHIQNAINSLQAIDRILKKPLQA